MSDTQKTPAASSANQKGTAPSLPCDNNGLEESGSDGAPGPFEFPARPDRLNRAMDPANLDKEFAQVPLFMKNMPAATDGDEFTALHALQALQFEGSPSEVAINFKNQGTDAFREKRYRDALHYYGQALEQKPSRGLTATLLTNRAAVNLILQNYGRVINDCAAALQLEKNNVKALYRCGRACLALEKYAEALECCVWAKRLDPENQAIKKLEADTTAAQNRAIAKENERVRLAELLQKQNSMIDEAIKIRKIELVSTPSELKKYPWQTIDQKQVTLLEDGTLSWPVFFLYPEHKQSDFFESFNETTTFHDQLEMIFETPSPWDNQTDPQYTLKSVDLFFSYKEKSGPNAGKDRLIKVPKSFCLGQALGHPKFVVAEGVPSFMVIPSASPFFKEYVKMFKK